MPEQLNLDLIEDRHITASLPRASKSDLIDSVADITDLLAEVRYLRIKARQFDKLMESHTMVHAEPRWANSLG